MTNNLCTEMRKSLQNFSKKINSQSLNSEINSFIYYNCLYENELEFNSSYKNFDNFIFNLYIVSNYCSEIINKVYITRDKYNFSVSIQRFKLNYYIKKNLDKNLYQSEVVYDYFIFYKKILQIIKNEIQKNTFKNFKLYIDEYNLIDYQGVNFCAICQSESIGILCCNKNHLLYCNDCKNDYMRYIFNNKNYIKIGKEKYLCNFFTVKCPICNTLN
jgi:hypothetical protein